VNSAHGKRLKIKSPRREKPKQKSEYRGERRRLIQLLVSLALFLTVFAGREAFSDSLQSWGVWLRTDTDFSAVFGELNQRLSDGQSVGQALKALWKDDEPDVSSVPEPSAEEVTLLSETGRLGLMVGQEYGIWESIASKAVLPEATQKPESAPQIVAAVAQTYAEDGTVLPANVSFLYYELGLERTAVPVQGTVTSGFGYRISPVNGKREFHLALDIAAEEGTEIAAFADGVVEYIGESDEFGLYLKIRHDNAVSTFYAHCSKLLVRKGDTVTCGQTVALVGRTGNATGAHLHLTIEKDNIRLDPAYYVDVA